MAAHSNSAWASDHFLVTDATVPPLPAEEEVAVEEEVEKTRPLFIKMPIRNGVRTYFIVPARRGRFQGTRPKLNVPH